MSKCRSVGTGTLAAGAASHSSICCQAASAVSGCCYTIGFVVIRANASSDCHSRPTRPAHRSSPRDCRCCRRFGLGLVRVARGTGTYIARWLAMYEFQRSRWANLQASSMSRHKPMYDDVCDGKVTTGARAWTPPAGQTRRAGLDCASRPSTASHTVERTKKFTRARRRRPRPASRGPARAGAPGRPRSVPAGTR